MFSLVNDDNFEINEPVICIKHRQKWIWQRLVWLSAARWNKNRFKIVKKITRLFRNYRNECNKHNITKRKLHTAEDLNTKMFEFMYNKMSTYDRQEFLQEYPSQKDTIDAITCKVCNDISSKPFVQCRYDNCTKMCQMCYTNWKSGSSRDKNGAFIFGHPSNREECPACNQSQLYECPICYEKKPGSNIIESDNCEHFICQKCFCTSFDSNPVVDCPMCRKQFKDTLGGTYYYDGLSEELIVV